MATRRVTRRPAEDVDEALDPDEAEFEPDVDSEPEEEVRPRRTTTKKAAPVKKAAAKRTPAPRAALRPAADDDDPIDNDDPIDDDDAVEDDEADDGEEEVVGVGWGAYNKAKAEMGSGFPDELTAGEEKILFKFLEDHPFASYGQHWADWLPRGSKLSYVCLKKTEKGCPLCDIGDNPSVKTFFNVLDLTDPDNPEVKILSLGVKNVNTIAAYNAEKKRRADGERVAWPINATDRYFSLQKTGTKKQSQIVVGSVKARDVEEDWGFVPFKSDELKPFLNKCFDKSAIPRSTRAVLEEVAEKASVDEDD